MYIQVDESLAFYESGAATRKKAGVTKWALEDLEQASARETRSRRSVLWSIRVLKWSKSRRTVG
uniref:Uncharacterized protein n=1 Tax=Hyaloperonospora arabidopsidis (strain Emoy2) TaxID=559515 RepID=M4B992_HYAAE